MSKELKKQKVQPKPVVKIFCPKCKELQLKIYPYSSYLLAQGVDDKVPCIKCLSV